MGVWHDGRVVETAYDEDVGLRPVVSLKPGVKVEWKNNGYYEIVGK